MTEQSESPRPKIVIGSTVDPAIKVDPVALGQTMQERGKKMYKQKR